MFLTVFTPTYNRIKLLSRLYQSLLSQTDNIEWLVIDDGSTDGTEELILSYLEKAAFPIRYIKKSRGGKHTAFNLAIQEARGDYLICIDSDDQLAEGAVESIRKSIPNLADRDIGFVGYKAITNRGFLQKRAQDDTHRGLYGYYSASGNVGEMSLVFRTELLRQYQFPEPQGELYVTECIVFDRMELDGYTLCPIHKVLEVCEYQTDGLSYNSSDYIFNSPVAQTIYHAQRMDLVKTKKERLGHALRFHAYNRISGNQGQYDGQHKTLLMATKPLSAIAEWYIRYKRKRDRK